MTVFISAVTQDPYFFGKGIEDMLLFQGIRYFLNVKERGVSLAERNKLYYEAGLLKDNLSDSCMIAHLNAEGRDGRVHGAWEGLFDRYEAWTVSLYNLRQIHSISDVTKVVYIVENPSVFRSLLLEGERLDKEQIGFVCTNGQLNLCGYVLLDLMQKSNIPMHYTGDLDPEGILVADKLKQRHRDNLYLRKSIVEDYHRIMLTSSIREKRLLSL